MGSNGKIIVITGGTGYLGSSVSSMLAGKGFTVAVIARQVEKSEHPLVHYFVGDVTDIVSLEKVAQKINSKFGQVTALISCVSKTLDRKPVISLSKEEFQGQFDVNVFGAFNFFKSFNPFMLPSGFIIGITSIYAMPGTAYPVSGSYIPAKYALRGLLRLLSKELSTSGIKVCAIAPAFMTGGLSSDLPDKVLEIIKRKSAPNETTTPDEVAKLLLKVINSEKDASGKMITVPGDIIIDL